VDTDLRLAWASWLESQPWDYFLTITFREPLPGHRADSTLNAIGKQLCATYRPEMVFLGAETHLSQAMHFHGLYKERAPPRPRPDWFWRLQAKALWQTLFETYGRSKVERVRGQGAVAKYVSKYCTKELGSYGIYGREDWAGK